MSAEKDYLDATGNYPFNLIFQLVEIALLKFKFGSEALFTESVTEVYHHWYWFRILSNSCLATK